MLKIYKIHNQAPSITWGSEYSACFDISCYFTFQTCIKTYTKTNDLVEALTSADDKGNYIELPSEWRMLLPTGIIFDIPEKHYVRIYARSGLSTKKGLNLINSVGIIDEDYVEELFIPIYNNSQQKIKIYSGDRIAQGELVKTVWEDNIITEISERPKRKTDRKGGFGSTGT